MQLPNFLIIGAYKAGTSSLYAYLKQHPDVYMSPLKEPRFFAYGADNPKHRTAKAFPIKSIEDYLELFRGVSTEKAVGEASPNYLHSKRAAHAIHAHIPDAKLIVCLRNPVDQAISLYGMRVRGGHEERPLDEALQSNDLHGGLYYEDMKRYLGLFGKNQLKIFLFDDLQRGALGVMRKTYGYLDVDDRFQPDVSVRHNTATSERSKVMRRMRELCRQNSRLRRALFMVPSGLRRSIADIGAREVEETVLIPPDTRGRLADFYHDDVVKLQDLIGRDLGAWLKSGPRPQSMPQGSANTRDE